jgi:hypothetical protein
MKIASRAGLIALFLLTSAFGLPAFAQRLIFPSDVEAVLDSLDRKASPGLFRPVHDDKGSTIASLPTLGGTEIRLLPVSTFESYNTNFPYGDDDGALWQGLGLNGISSAGAEIAWAWGSIKLDPEWWFAQNLGYEHALGSAPGSNGDYWWGLDRLQSYGTGFYQSFDWGQSEVRLRYGGFTLGFGTENLQLGPAEIQNIILSNNAPGFPLLDLGTDGPIATKFGAFDARFFWGQTQTSQWYDSDPSTDKFLWCGGTFSYSPPFLDSMSFGFIRAFHSPWSTMDGWKLFEFFDDTVWKYYRDAPLTANGQDDIDQVLSFTWEWRVPETGSRFYLEWARNDSAGDIMDFIMQPDHSDGYTAGIQQKLTFKDASRLLVSVEISDLGNNIGTTVRPTGSWYRHSVDDNDDIDPGYTDDGQVMGAPEGPGSNTQEINLYYLRDGWFVGLGLQRVNFDADYYYSFYSSDNNYEGYNLLLTAALRGGIRIDKLELGAMLAFVQNWNQGFILGNYVYGWHFEFAMKYAL